MTQTTEYQGPLAELNVIDFGHYYAGPMAGMLLADQGATVIHIIRPGKPELPQQQYRLLNRNKKLLTLDLKTDEGKAQALSLIENADVVIENFRPGVMQRLGLDYANVKDTNPGLVYLSLPGFVSTDKERAHIQAWEGVMGAAAAVFTESHWFRQKLNFPPVYSWVPMCSAHGSMQGAIAVLAALIARGNRGAGTWLEVSQIAAAIAGITPAVFVHKPYNSVTDADGQISDAFKPFAYNSADSESEQLNKLDSVTRAMAMGPLQKFYPCADGREIMLWVQTPDLFSKALGIEKRLKNESIDLTDWMMGPEKRQRLTEIISEMMLSKTSEVWEAILGEAGVAVSIIRTRQEWMALESMLKAGVFTKMDNGKSELMVPGSFADVSGPEGALVSNDFKEPQSTTFAEAKQQLTPRIGPKSLSDKPLSLKKGDFLKGLKVLDLTNLVAGPTATYTLAQYGAEVIKADSTNSQPVGLIAACMLEVNQGKRSILTDLTTAPGREIFRRLVCWADVVVHNSVDGVAERLGVTLSQLQLINPNVVVCQFSAYGGLYRDGWEKRPGFDPNAQAVSGMMAHYGTLEKPQPHGMISCGDIMGGIGGTFSALLGVYQQRTTGYAGEARCSLARMLNYIQLPGMISENGSCDWGEARGQFALGEPLAGKEPSADSNKAALWQRLYRCSDKWLYVGTRKKHTGILMEMITGHQDSDEEALEATFAQHECAYWQTKLIAANIGCHPVIGIEEIRAQGVRSVNNGEADETASGSVEVLIREDHPCGEPMVFIAPTWVRVGSNKSYKRLTPAPKYGQHTAEILRDLGYRDDEIAELIRINVSHEFLPMIGSKEAYFYEPGQQ